MKDVVVVIDLNLTLVSENRKRVRPGAVQFLKSFGEDAVVFVWSCSTMKNILRTWRRVEKLNGGHPFPNVFFIGQDACT